MSELELIIRDEIKAGGPITFARFVELALYHPLHGYYTSGRASIGRSGDFYTNPHMGPAFGRLVCESFIKLKNRIGEGPCSFIEMGAGEGWLARDFIESMQREHASEAAGCGYIIVERSEAMRDKQKRTLGPLSDMVKWAGSVGELPDGVEGVFFSNELMDALPFHVVRQYEDALMEVYVGAHEEGFHEVTGQLSTPKIPRYLNRIATRLPRGMTTEVRLAACSLIGEVAGKLSRGFIVTVDYGYPACDYFSAKHMEGTMACYHNHRASRDPFALVGEQDITAHVDFSSLCQKGLDYKTEPVLFTDQTSFLMDAAMGLEKRLSNSTAAQEKLEELGMGIKALVHPEWMGGAFKVLVQAKGVDTAGLFDGVRDGKKRLCQCDEPDSFRLT